MIVHSIFLLEQITLQRTAGELGGNVGQLTIGELPGNLSDSSLTYLPVRLYSPDEGGIPGPSSNPSAVCITNRLKDLA